MSLFYMKVKLVSKKLVCVKNYELINNNKTVPFLKYELLMQSVDVFWLEIYSKINDTSYSIKIHTILYKLIIECEDF